MNDSAPSKLVPELHCPDCKKPMRVRTVLPMFDELWDLSFECDQCGKTSSVVHERKISNPLMKRREPTKPQPPPAALLWLLGGAAVALAVLPAIFARSPASEQNKELAVLTAPPMQSNQDKDLTVFATSSMQDALDDINAAFTESTGVKVIAGYASSSALIRQIAQGAAADVFASADSDSMNWGLKRKLIKDARVNLLGNRLVLIAPKDSKLDRVAIGPNFDLAKLAGDGSIAIGDLEDMSAGRYAKAALETLGALQAAAPKLVVVPNVRAAVKVVERGAAPLGIVYATDAKVSPGVKIIGTFPADSHPAISYPVAATVTAKPIAVGYLVFLRSMSAKAIFEQYGFEFLIRPTS